MRPYFAGKRVLLTGHTGFKGGWLALWLSELGAKVSGYALDPEGEESMFAQARVADVVDDARGDVRDAKGVVDRVGAVAPDVVFHLAAQPIVRASYDDPVGTMSTNVMGTVHVLDAVRRLARPCVVVVVTSDKCYENTGQVYGYRESDPLGGSDPYSASKAAAEIVTASYAKSFFGDAVKVASARAGNVIGGGDYAKDRLVPDVVRAARKKETLHLRHPEAVRPWQHVLEPLAGYLWLAARLGTERSSFGGAWNFGPLSEGFRTVGEIAARAGEVFGGQKIARGDVDPKRREMDFLTLATDKARRGLGWHAVWNVDRAVDETMEWYRAVAAGADGRETTLAQIRAYTSEAKARGVAWSESA